jgi:hypothetical protein
MLALRGESYLTTEKPLHLESCCDSGGPEYLQFDKDYFAALLAFLDDTNQVSADETARQINNALLPQAAVSSDAFGLAIDLWAILIDTVLVLPYESQLQDKLVDLIVAFRAISPESAKKSFSDDGVSLTSGQIYYDLNICDRDIGTRWLISHTCTLHSKIVTEVFILLLLVGNKYADTLFTEHPRGNRPKYLNWARGASYASPPEQDSKFELDKYQILTWIKVHAFKARLLASGISTRGLTRYASRAFSESSLERPCLRAEYALDIVSCDIRTTAMWIFYAGRTVYEQCKEELTGVSIENGPLFTGKPGLNIQRWQFWKSRYQQLIEQYPKLDTTTITIAQQAIADMEVIERKAVPEPGGGG